jgi:hypothetical protein
MFNFIKKRNNAHVDLNEQSTGVRGEYNAKIERIKKSARHQWSKLQASSRSIRPSLKWTM